jgi:hypothetical protein
VHRRFLLPDGVPKPGPGSVVVVPEREPGQSQLLAALPIVAQITASLVAIVAVLRR